LGAGVAFSLLAAVGNGLGAVLSRRAYAVAAAADQDIDGATAAYQRLIGGLAVAGVSLLIAKRHYLKAVLLGLAPPPLIGTTQKWRRGLPWVVANAVAGQTLGVSCYQWALKTTPTGLVLAIVATAPLAVIPFSQRWENEKAPARSLAGGLLAVVGAVALIACR
jgi:hypothetical protein